MSSLAKQILAHKRLNPVTDDLGIPLKDQSGREVKTLPQYYVARTFIMEKTNPRYDPNSTVRLHMRTDTIYQSNKEVLEIPSSFYRLTGVNYKVPSQIQIIYWEELKRRLPRLNPNIYKVSDGIWWDKVSGEIVEGDANAIRKRAVEKDYQTL